MKYRREIDGLRAVAVIPVVLFHAGFEWARGGYVGVDVFFVISGYLITSLIWEEIAAGKFSIVHFYERRARRILPAMFVMMAVCVPVAACTMLPDDFENFGQSLFASVFFGNNVLLAVTSGYWGMANEFKPLLHTWSLGVEEQYYIVFPALILAVRQLHAKFAFGVLLLIAAASLVAAQVFSAGNFHLLSGLPGMANSVGSRVLSFYLLPARFWELLIGALLALRPTAKARPRNLPSTGVVAVLGWLGLVLIAGSVIIFDAKTPHPGLWTLVPTIGAALVIGTATEGTPAGRMLSNRAMVAVGLISYSIYLWHQPILAFARVASITPPGDGVVIAALAATLVVAIVSWRYVELPCRAGSALSRSKFVACAVAGGLTLAATGLALYLTAGFASHWPELKAHGMQLGRHLNAEYNERPLRFTNAEFIPDQRRKVLVLGNSFARDFINAGIENHCFSDCQLSYGKSIPACIANVSEIEGGLRARIAACDYLILASTNYDTSCWRNDLAAFRRLGARTVIVIGTKNFGWNLNAVMRLEPDVRYKFRALVLQPVWERNERFAKTIGPEHYVDLLGMIADPERRVPVFTDEKRLISQDREHLTIDGAKYIGKIIFEHPLLRDLR